jgi:hypothetical protein
MSQAISVGLLLHGLCGIPFAESLLSLLAHRSQRWPRVHRASMATTGGVFDHEFLSSIESFYSPDTGTELMGPLIYSLFRSTRPATTVELGAGYTTMWLVKAAHDAMREAAQERDSSWVLWDSDVGRNTVMQAQRDGTLTGKGTRAATAQKAYSPKVHCVDIFDIAAGSHYGNMGAFEAALESMTGAKNGGSWQLHTSDWGDWVKSWDTRIPIDLLWLDGFNRETFDAYWPLVNPDGGVCILHSTLNNHKNYAFIQELKLQQATKSFCDFELLSLCEPHKWNQNSCTLLRKTSQFDSAEHLVRGRA